MNNNSKGVTLVIGSGAIKCAAVLGLWQVLIDEEIPIDMIVGCSGGSVYGAGMALGMSIEQVKKISEETWTTELMMDYMVNLRASKDGTLKFDERSGLVNDEVLNKRLSNIFQERTFEETRTPFLIVSTDMMTGEKITISSGRLYDAVRASIAIPMIFPPWEIDGRLLVDGAASDPLPIDIAIQNGANVIIAMGFTNDYKKKFKSLTAVQEHMTSVYMNNILKSTFAFNNLAHHSEIFPVIPEFDMPLSMFDVHKIPYIIEKGAEAARQAVPHIKKLLA